jgi:peptidylprolyl isomerase
MMNTIAKINDEIITTDQFIKFLKFSNEFPDLMERLIRNKVTVHAAKKMGMSVSVEEVQDAADDFRRCIGLHRAKDTQQWMDKIGISDEEFESFITEHVYRKKILETFLNHETIETYFRLNAPKFDTADICHIVVDGGEKAKELMALLEEEPERFDEFVKEYSSDDETRDIGGRITGIRRGILPPEIDAKVFNASAGEIAGPFRVNGSEVYEIIRIAEVNTASQESVKEKIAETMYDEWIEKQMKEHTIVLLEN